MTKWPVSPSEYHTMEVQEWGQESFSYAPFKVYADIKESKTKIFKNMFYFTSVFLFFFLDDKPSDYYVNDRVEICERQIAVAGMFQYFMFRVLFLPNDCFQDVSKP